jgi:SHS2 domain-containing protein
VLLVSWLNELIFLFDTDYLLLTYLEITSLTETSSGMQLQAKVAGEVYDATRHELSSAIKAVTWHEAAVEGSDGTGYRARLICDI